MRLVLLIMVLCFAGMPNSAVGQVEFPRAQVIEALPQPVDVDLLGFLAPPAAKPKAVLGLGRHVRIMHVTAAPPVLTKMDRLIPAVQVFRNEILDQPEVLRLVENRKALDAVVAEASHVGIILGLQHSPDDLDLNGLRDLWRLGIRIMAPTYDKINQYGGGYQAATIGLTERGKQLIRDMTAVGMIVDFSHVGHQTARDIFRLVRSEKLPSKVVATHGGCYSLYRSDRNHMDDVYHGIVRQGGVVGVYALTFGLHSEDNSLEPMLRHIKYAVNRFGADHVCLGTDAVYQERSEEEWRAGYDRLKKLVDPANLLASRWPDYPMALNRVDKVGAIEDALVRANMPRPKARKIGGSNALRFLQNNLPAQ